MSTSKTPWMVLVVNIIVVFLYLSASTPPNAIITTLGTVMAMRIMPSELADPKSEITNQVVVMKNILNPIIAKSYL